VLNLAECAEPLVTRARTRIMGDHSDNL